MRKDRNFDQLREVTFETNVNLINFLNGNYLYFSVNCSKYVSKVVKNGIHFFFFFLYQESFLFTILHLL